MRPVAEFEGHVMQTRALAGREVDGVMVGAATHEAEEILLPIRDPEAEHLLVEVDAGMDVGHHERDMAKLCRANGGRLADRGGRPRFIEDLDGGALGVLKPQELLQAGQRHLVDARPDAFASERFGERRQVVLRRDLKSDLGELGRRAAMQDDTEVAEPADKQHPVLVLRQRHEADHAGIIVGLPLHIRRFKCGVADPLDPDHRLRPRPFASSAWPTAPGRATARTESRVCTAVCRQRGRGAFTNS